VTELLEKYLAMTVSVIILFSLAGPILKDGGTLVSDCHRLILVKVLLDEVDFGVAESIRRNGSYEKVVLVPSKLRFGAERTRLIISFPGFGREIVLSHEYIKPISLRPPITEGSYLLHITCTCEVIAISFRWI
jgi:hypothetical protein